ncbi:MAG: sulfotransferase family 2 domain-containing protein [Caldilineaceae bacterium]|nr:sulfotransferase family 2 domain-containing protein [Caldilineaceae bacterium]
MNVATSEPQPYSIKRRLKSVVRRTRKAPVKALLRLQGYDNSLPILLEPFNAIYFQIPKVASTALKTLFKKELGLPGLAPHATRFPVLTMGEIETGPYSSHFKFCFIRNPWARIASCYQSKVVNSRNLNQTFWTQCLYYVMPRSAGALRHRLASFLVLNANMSFEEFVNAVAEIPDEYADKHFRSQYTFLCNASGELLVDYVGHLETFKDDFQQVAQRIGLGGESLQRGSEKKRPSYHYKDYYDKNTWEIIARRYQKDIELLGYEDCRL